MGLDITYYEKIEPATIPNGVSQEDFVEEDYENQIYWYTVKGMEGHLDGIEAKIISVSGKSGRFTAGSYSGHNRWRNLLCLTILGVEPDTVWANPLKYQNAPFYELINFADNEGCIGPKTSAKLAKDFEAYEERFITHFGMEDYDIQKYREWKIAFQIAAGSGCVEFH